MKEVEKSFVDWMKDPTKPKKKKSPFVDTKVRCILYSIEEKIRMDSCLQVVKEIQSVLDTNPYLSSDVREGLYRNMDMMKSRYEFYVRVKDRK